MSKLQLLFKDAIKDIQLKSAESNNFEIYDEVKKFISTSYQESMANGSNESMDENFVMTFGFNLLIEMAFILIVQCKSIVMPHSLKILLIDEYSKILDSLV